MVKYGQEYISEDVKSPEYMFVYYIGCGMVIIWVIETPLLFEIINLSVSTIRTASSIRNNIKDSNDTFETIPVVDTDVDVVTKE